jgi:protein SSD1
MGAATRPSNAESALFEDDDEEEQDQEEGQVKEVANASSSIQRQKSTQKQEIKFDGVEQTAAGHCIQTVKELQSGTFPQRLIVVL